MMLAIKSSQSEWTTHAAWAERFVASMWDASGGRFYVGTANDGVSPNETFKPEDVNTWSYLAFANPAWAAAPSWDVANLPASEGGFSGVSLCSGDRSGVWFEVTAHLADALDLRNASGDRDQAQHIFAISNTCKRTDHMGMASASSPPLKQSAIVMATSIFRRFTSAQPPGTSWQQAA
jgi:hypothetical protein